MKKFELKVLIKLLKKNDCYQVNFNMSSPSLSSLYNLNKKISMVLKINKKKLRALAEKERKAKPKILKEHHREFIIKFVDEHKRKYFTISAL